MHATTRAAKADGALPQRTSITDTTAIALVLAASLRNPLTAVALLTFASLQHTN